MASFFSSLSKIITGSCPSSSSSLPSLSSPIKRIAILGAGPCGLATAKYLRAQNAFDTITLYERQPANAAGGVWYYTPETAAPPSLPQPDPRARPHDCVRGSTPPFFASAMYDELHANIMGSLMQYDEVPFPADARLFPSRQIIRDYVLAYGRDLQPLVRYSHEVTCVSLSATPAGVDQWIVEARDLVAGTTSSAVYDAVVIANGHYTLPYVPSIAGLAEFAAAHPGIVSHSKQYRSKQVFTGKRVIVVGNGPSGADIARQIGQVAAQPLYLSVRHATAPDRLAHIGATEVPEISEFLPSTRGVRLIDGTEISDIDALIFSTGYFFSYPFLEDLQDKLITSGRGVRGLYQHLFYAEHPTLAFSGLLQQAVPYSVAEAQAAALAAVWSGKEHLPSLEKMKAWLQELEAERGESLHNMPRGTDGAYINELHDWVAKSTVKKPPYWDDHKLWQRKLFIEAKLRFEKGGCTAKTLEDLGFKYPEVPNESPV
ncbi:hypothetical protein TD95_003565 [Thielaviopsis punctulata]|uniref:FAD/NAD(P)-binding domain-containing protein n=1 Tax=Thielaviopsis punctulata TaxID=72032 RepID=A0A0F4ZD64_9PEZI|nr:hypothetical protein TD95_003565 [Thielaviopsis punctulata]